MALVPVPGSQLTGQSAEIEAAIPAEVNDLLATIREAGHAAHVVGGSLRDVVLGRTPADWDLASEALPDEIIALLPDAVYENQFGTVAVRRSGQHFEITTFRTDHDYADFRRPHRVEFGDSIEADLARRDFTVNAMAWGGRPGEEPALVDPYGGVLDARARVLRAVGNPATRFQEDALRMIRAVRLATTLGFDVEADTLVGIRTHAELVGHLSGERIAAELDKLLAAPAPSIGLRLLRDTGLLVHVSPELAAERGIVQNKIPGEDLWDHTLRTVDAAPASRPAVRLAALLHDVGKPVTFVNGHFLGHDAVGAQLAGAFLERLHVPRSVHGRVVGLVGLHMFSYEPNWSDAAVRRFIAKLRALGDGFIEDLLALRAADNVGSGLRLDELRARISAELAAEAVLDRSGLVVDGADLMTELGLEQGPLLGRILDALVERVIADPSANDRPTLLLLAQAMLTEDR